MAIPIPVGGYKRNVGDVAQDLKGIEGSLPGAVMKAMLGTAQRLVEEVALPLTPVDTGFMRSRWSISAPNLATNTVTVSNDTYYLPFVNQWFHPGFAEEIADHTPGILAAEIRNLGFKFNIVKRTTQIDYNKPEWWAKKAWQDPLKFAQYGRGVLWREYQYEGD